MTDLTSMKIKFAKTAVFAKKLKLSPEIYKAIIGVSCFRRNHKVWEGPSNQLVLAFIGMYQLASACFALALIGPLPIRAY